MSSKSYFEEVAGQWDQMSKEFFSDAVREKAFEVAGIEKGKVAADLGAGTGFITEGLISAGLQVIAVDQSEQMLEVMKQKFSGVEGIDYRMGDAEALPLDDQSVDYVFANMYLHHVEEPITAIREMVRILKPGGKVVITDLDEHNHEFLRTEQHDRWLGFKHEDIRNWLEAAGLSDVTVECVGENCCAESSCACETAAINIFAARGVK
ncbi:MAG: class I SAM-dependent methyltransferase [Calditrichaeota bacterium]|nr:MAG: class I SAM-dependent methyltransferase [Calditrichota bacterium]